MIGSGLGTKANFSEAAANSVNEEGGSGIEDFVDERGFVDGRGGNGTEGFDKERGGGDV